ncbi:MAG: YcgL domain-containing protein [Pseudomonadales bacterium]
MSLLVRVYASRSRPDCYLYVPQAEDLSAVPDALQRQLAPLRQALELELDEQTRLARACAGAVLEQLRSEGFYLQLPPPTETTR